MYIVHGINRLPSILQEIPREPRHVSRDACLHRALEYALYTARSFAFRIENASRQSL